MLLENHVKSLYTSVMYKSGAYILWNLLLLEAIYANPKCTERHAVRIYVEGDMPAANEIYF